MVANLPPILVRWNKGVGKVSGAMAQMLVLPAPGTPVAAKGPVINEITFLGSNASCKSQSPGATAKSQNMAAPIPTPPPNSSYWAVSSRADLFGRQIYLQYLSCISICHFYAPSFGAGFGAILGDVFAGGARLTSYPATSNCEGASVTSLSALAAQVSTQACLPPGPPFWLQ